MSHDIGIACRRSSEWPWSRRLGHVELLQASSGHHRCPRRSSPSPRSPAPTASPRAGSAGSWPATGPRARPRSSRGHAPRRPAPTATAASDRRAGPASCASSSPRPAWTPAPTRSAGTSNTTTTTDAVAGHDQPDPGPRRRGHPGPVEATRSRSYIRFEAEQPNETWQSDFTHYRLTADGTRRRHRDPHLARRPLPLRPARSPPTAGSPARSCWPPSAQAVDQHGYPASTLTDNGMVFTTRFAGGRGGRNRLEAELRRLRHRPEELPTQPPHHLRQGRTVPTDPEEVAPRPTRPADHHRRAPDPPRHVPRRLQPPATAPLAPPPRHPRHRLHARPKATPGTDRTNDTHDRVRHDRIDNSRHRHPARRRPDSTTSASAEPTPEPTSSCSSTTSTSASSTPPPANSSATSPSTHAATTNPPADHPDPPQNEVARTYES